MIPSTELLSKALSVASKPVTRASPQASSSFEKAVGQAHLTASASERPEPPAQQQAPHGPETAPEQPLTPPQSRAPPPPGSRPGQGSLVAAGPTELRPADLAVGLVYDKLMELHQGPPDHVERPLRVTTLMEKLTASGLAARCSTLLPRKASTEELLLAHTRTHIEGMDRGRRRSLEVVGRTYEDTEGKTVETAEELQGEPHTNGRALPADPPGAAPEEEGEDLVEDGDCYYNRHTAGAARMAAGCTLQAVEAVMAGEVQRAFAVVRPPGHHAECDRALGFCFYNNVALAALRARRLGAARVLVLDWDVHHGNGIQDILYSDPSILYVSLHRGNGFYPGTGFAQEVGAGKARGANLNVVFPWGGFADADYLAAFDLVIEPVVRQFDPDLVIVSAGYDAVVGDPLGGQSVSPEGYAHMAERLTRFAGGRLVLALEGGYNVRQTAECAAECVKVLLGEAAPPLEKAPLRQNVGVVLYQTLKAHAPLCAALEPLGDAKAFSSAWDAYELSHSLDLSLNVKEKDGRSRPARKSVTR